jgi:GMP synthase-like glutamine amidotransferase
VYFIKEVLAQSRVKVIGVCYGHQIVGRALGAKGAKSEGGAWEVSVCQVEQTSKGKALFGGKDHLVRTSTILR